MVCLNGSYSFLNRITTHDIKGEKGNDGDKGVDGLPGEDGSKGEKGHAGEKGTKGQPGFEGQKGKLGRQGRAGPQGLKGFKGAPGVAGFAGPKGMKGIGEPSMMTIGMLGIHLLVNHKKLDFWALTTDPNRQLKSGQDQAHAKVKVEPLG
ncbi:Otolin-1-A [Portunus trituberculatus]|uniref:Otolin-1-A n=1 Tax=Portunus trituberculatus TaxID=210409 RepID=A0A5B7H586_PORTR|nr:Otolin-1-A [Portunus trituberculatus]